MDSSNSITAKFTFYYPNNRHEAALHVELDLPGRGVTAVFGPSGSGKTTLLRCLAGMEQADNGLLVINGRIWQDASTFIPVHKRPLGYVFQEASLFAHLSALDNLNYAVKRAASNRDSLNLEQAVEIMGIAPLLQRFPSQLSGGERQRVAIARALLIQPEILLMDEPLASLDNQRKQEILPYLERLRAAIDIPMIYVSHSIDEITRLADTLVVLQAGKAVAQGPLTDITSRVDLPVSFGDQTGSVLEGRISVKDQQWHLVKVVFAGGELWVRDNDYALEQAVRLQVFARDISLTLSDHQDSSILNKLKVKVIGMTDDSDPSMQLISLACGDSRLIARVTRRSAHQLQIQTGKTVWAQIKSAALIR